MFSVPFFVTTVNRVRELFGRFFFQSGEPGALPVVEVPLRIGFVSRAITETESPYYEGSKGLAGVGSFSRYQSAAPGKLLELRHEAEPKGIQINYAGRPLNSCTITLVTSH